MMNEGLYVRPAKRVEHVETVQGSSKREGKALAWERVTELAKEATAAGFGGRFGYSLQSKGYGRYWILRTDRSIPEKVCASPRT